MHLCGNPIHDLILNLILIFTVCPEWLPFGLAIKSWAVCLQKKVEEE